MRPLLATCLIAIVGLAACGDSEEPDPGDPADGGGAALTVTLDRDGPEGPQKPETAEVSCEAESEDTACAAATRLEAGAFDPTPPDVACTELYGGPDVATIEGTIAEVEVNAELTRSNGCEIERFDAAVPLLQALFEDYTPGASLSP